MTSQYWTKHLYLMEKKHNLLRRNKIENEIKCCEVASIYRLLYFYRICKSAIWEFLRNKL
jgi:hypothetical protein